MLPFSSGGDQDVLFVANQVMFSVIVQLSKTVYVFLVANQVTWQETVGIRETGRGRLHRAAGVPAHKPHC